MNTKKLNQNLARAAKNFLSNWRKCERLRATTIRKNIEVAEEKLSQSEMELEYYIKISEL